MAALITGVLAVSWAAIIVRACDAPAVAIAFYRLFLASVCMLPGWILVQGPKGWAKPKHMLWTGLSGMALGGHFILWILAVKLIPIAMATLLSSTHPVFVGLMSRFILGEPLSPALWAGISLCLVGYGVVSFPAWGQSSAQQAGYMCAVGAAFLFAVYLMVGRGMRQRMGLIDYLLPTYLGGSGLCLAAALVLGTPLVHYDAGTWLMLLLMALIPTLVGHSLVNAAVRRLSAPLVACSVLGEPVLASLWAWLLFREWITGWQLAGAVVVVAGIVLALRGEGLPSRPIQRAPDIALEEKDP